MKKVFLLAGMVLGVLIVGLLWYGFIPVKTQDYPIPVSTFKNWEEVFKSTGQFKLAAWQTGSISVKNRTVFLDQKADLLKAFNDKRKTVPAWAYYLKHPVWGEMLIDTGFDKSFSTPQHGNYNLAGRLFTWLKDTKHRQQAGESLEERMQLTQAHPKKVFLTHLHFDHAAGLPALGGSVPVMVGKGELDFISRATSGHYLAQLPAVYEIDMTRGQAMPPFDKAVDIFGDGSLWAIQTCGHTPMHLSYLVMTNEGPMLLTGDACFYYQALKLGIGPFSPYPGLLENARRSFGQIRTFVETYPQVRVFVGHDDLENQPIPRGR